MRVDLRPQLRQALPRGPSVGNKSQVTRGWFAHHASTACAFGSLAVSTTTESRWDCTAETLPPMEAQRGKRHVARLNIDVRTTQPWTSICFAIDVKRVKMGVAPREDDLQLRMEGGQRHVAAEEKPAPDQGADPLRHHPELIDVG